MMDNLMEKYFISLMKDIIADEQFIIGSDIYLVYECNDERRFEYYPETYHLIIYQNFRSMFTKIFSVSDTRAKSFLKRMIIKHYELDVRSVG